MKVILLKDIKNVGKKYEIKDLKDGYIRNFLLPNKLVKILTEKSMNWLEMEKKKETKKAEEELQKIQKIASELDGQELIFEERVGSEGNIYESITALKISKKLKEMGFDVKREEINLEKPIKEKGEFSVKINLKYNLQAEIKIIVSEK